MRSSFVWMCAAVAVVVSVVAADQQPFSVPDYHSSVGIPEATRIRRAEAALDFDGSRVAGGSAVSLGTYPFLAGVLVQLVTGETSVCGGSLVSDMRVVTAAHCWRSVFHQGRQITIVLGSIRLFSGGTRVNSNTVHVHSGFNPNNLNNDIAVINIPRVSLNNNIRVIALPSPAMQILSFVGYRAQLVGYGRQSESDSITNSQAARHVTAEVIHNDACAVAYGFNVIASTLCTSGQGGIGPCGGDAGSPLTITYGGQRVLIGVTSFYSGMGCRVSYPGGYARVTSFTPWIQSRL